MTHLDDIQIRDPYVLRADGRYWLFGSTDENIWSGPATGFDTWWSDDLSEWHGPIAAFRPSDDFWSHTEYWAPEVHEHDGGFFMFATFTAPGARRGTQILRAARPEGPYEPWSDGPVTPRAWECLDGTLAFEGDTPHMVFCHEWKDVGDGEIWSLPLTDDLRAPAADPRLLFRASEAAWVRPLLGRPEFPVVFVTDGPFVFDAPGGALRMLWSSFGESGYAMGVATSPSGSLFGPWEQADEAIWPLDGGHGMVFRDEAGRAHLTLHTPNRTPDERARFVPLVEDAQGVRLAD